MKKTFLFATALAALSMFCSCKDEIEMRYPPKYELPELPTVEGIHENQKAPLYWSVYENCYLQERQGHTGEDLDISEAEWDNIIDWVATNCMRCSILYRRKRTLPVVETYHKAEDGI